MPRFKHLLNHVEVAAPCKADWDQMIGSEQMRFCGQCDLNVYNLSGMTRDEAESLIARNEGRLCVRFYRRTDGSIITRDCPVGLRAIRDRVSYWTKAVGAAALTFMATVGFYRLSEVRPFAPRMTMGAMISPVHQVELIQGGIAPPQTTERFEMGEMIAKQPPRRPKH
ncbi:MAG TPA: hypothetical protein DC054_16950 [Blastocatellia bacterium]|nr:hypothetical protein [Blastocatellia bacterium]